MLEIRELIKDANDSLDKCEKNLQNIKVDLEYAKNHYRVFNIDYEKAFILMDALEDSPEKSELENLISNLESKYNKINEEADDIPIDLE